MVHLLTTRTIADDLDNYYYVYQYFYNEVDFNIMVVKKEKSLRDNTHEMSWSFNLNGVEIDNFIMRWINNPAYCDILTQVYRDIKLSRI